MKILLVLAPLSLVLLAACGGAPAAPTGGSPGPTAGSPAPTQGGAAVACAPGQSTGDAAVEIVDFAFNPAQLTINAGQAVAWTNGGDAPHTVTFDGGPDCGRVEPGGSVAATFSQAGDYSYICAIHPQMRATITVDP